MIISKINVVKGKIEQHLNVFVLVCCGEADSQASVTGLRTHCSHKKGDGRRGRKKGTFATNCLRALSCKEG